MEKFIFMGTQRTGTTLLVSLLNSSPNVLCIGEALHSMADSENKILNWEYSYQHYLNKKFFRRIKHFYNRSSLLSQYLNFLYSHHNFSAIGFKLLLYQTTRFPILKNYLIENQIKVIRTTRKNLLKKYVSLYVARKRKKYGSNKKLSTLKIIINKDTIIDELNKIKKDDQLVDDYIKGLNFIKISYEDILLDMNEQCSIIKNFLCLNPFEKLTTDLVKMNPDNLEEIVENYDEINKILSDSEYNFCLY